MPWDYTTALVLLYLVMSMGRNRDGGLQPGHDANICCSSSIGFSLRHCLLLSPYVATPAALVVGWSNDVKHNLPLVGIKNHKGMYSIIALLHLVLIEDKYIFRRLTRIPYSR